MSVVRFPIINREGTFDLRDVVSCDWDTQRPLETEKRDDRRFTDSCRPFLVLKFDETLLYEMLDQNEYKVSHI